MYRKAVETYNFGQPHTFVLKIVHFVDQTVRSAKRDKQ